MIASGACHRHWPALVDLLEDPLGGRLPSGARAHLDVCAVCHAEFGQLVLAGHTVRRAFAEACDAQPSSSAWLRLRARIQRRPPGLGRAASPILGVALSAGLSAALLLPLGAMRLGAAPDSGQPPAIMEAGLDAAAIIAAGRRDAEGEARYWRERTRVVRDVSLRERNTRARQALIRLETTPEPARRRTVPRTLAASVQ